MIIRYKLHGYLNTFLINNSWVKRKSEKYYKTIYLSKIYIFNIISINNRIFSEI